MGVAAGKTSGGRSGVSALCEKTACVCSLCDIVLQRFNGVVMFARAKNEGVSVCSRKPVRWGWRLERCRRSHLGECAV